MVIQNRNIKHIIVSKCMSSISRMQTIIKIKHEHNEQHDSQTMMQWAYLYFAYCPIIIPILSSHSILVTQLLD